MQHPPKCRLAKLLTALMALAIGTAMAAACGGGGSDGGSPTPVASPGASPTPVASPGASPTPVASPGAATAAPCQALAAAKSFRYVSKVTLESPQTTETPTADLPLPSSTLTRPFGGPFLYEYDTDASVITPDRFHFTISTSDVSGVDIIAIGQEVWQDVDGTWQLQAQAPDIPYQPIPLCEAILPELDLSKTEPQPAEIDGLKTIHYAFPKNPSPQGVAKVFGEGSDMDRLIRTLDVGLWLSEDGTQLVRLEFSGKGLYSDGRPLMVHVLLDVRDVNGEDITIEPPA